MVEPVLTVLVAVVGRPLLAVLAAVALVPFLVLVLQMHHHMILLILRCDEVGSGSSR